MNVILIGSLGLMRTLYLLRHAKSSWKDQSLGDFDRALKKRGRKAAEAIGRFIRSENLSLPLVISSPALRARETTEIVLSSAGLKPEVHYDERIYEADLRRLLRVIAEIEDEKDAALLVGHNPGLEELLQFLTGQSRRMATAALAKITMERHKWSRVGEGKASLDWLVTPKDLSET